MHTRQRAGPLERNKTNWHMDRGRQRLNTMGNERQVQHIRAWPVVTKGQEVNLQREEK